MSRFVLFACTVNWGRGYSPGELKANIRNVMRLADRWEHVVLLPQELDEEPDPAHEHPAFNSMLEPGSKKVFWHSREPIVLSPDFKVTRRRRRLTMGAGTEIDRRLNGVGPRRYAVTCVAEYDGIMLGFGNTHPHRRGLDWRVERARTQGRGVFRDELRLLRASNGGISGVWGADMNDTHVPRMVPRERVAIHKGLDHLRYWQHPHGARMTLLDSGSLRGTIDPHDPLWARWLVEDH